MKDSYDVVIIGGAVIGSSVAYFLSANPDFGGSILVVEPDPTYEFASTSLSGASLRTQFSNALNVKISQFGLEVIQSFPDLMEVEGDRPNLNFHPGGYLFLARTEAEADHLSAKNKVQVQCGADVVLWDQNQLADAFPHLNVDDILLASYGQSGEGWFDNTGLMMGFRNKARALGTTYVKDRVVGLDQQSDRVTGVRLASGAWVSAGHVVNAAGPRAAQIADMLDIPLPVEPRKRMTFVFDAAETPEGSANVNGGRLPLMIDPTGVHCRPEGRYFVAGCAPAEDGPAEWDDFDQRHHEFEDIIWPALAARSKGFEAIKVVRSWAGHYAFNTLDHNLIVGPHTQISNFYFANGFSGHGLQQSPATGRAVSEIIIYGAYRTLDLSPLGYARIETGTPFAEYAVI